MSEMEMSEYEERRSGGRMNSRLRAAATKSGQAGLGRVPQSAEADFVAARPVGANSFARRPFRLHSVSFRLLSLLAPFKREVALAMLLGLGTIGAGVGLMTTSAWLISAAALHPNEAVLAVAIVGVRFFGLARGIFRYLERLCSHDVTLRLLARLRVWVYRAIEPLAPSQLASQRGGDLLARGAADVDTLQQLYVRVISPPAVALATGLALFVFLARFDLVVALTAVGLLAATGAAATLAARWLAHRPEREIICLRAALMAATVDFTQGLAELVAYGQDEAKVAEIGRLSDDLTRNQRRLAWAAGFSDALLTAGTGLALLATLLVAIPLVSAGRLDGVWLAALGLAVSASFEAINPLPEAARYGEAAVVAGERIFGLEGMGARSSGDDRATETAPKGLATTKSGQAGLGDESQSAKADFVADAPRRGFNRPVTAAAAAATLALHNISARYAPDEPLALDGVSLTLRRGELVALVGPSGAGKSTLVGVIEQFLAPERGSVTLDGVDTRSLQPDDVRAKLAVISQKTYLFNTTIRQNLLIARPDASEAEVIATARQAQIHDAIMALPQGYETLVGEQGARLSGGERQRLAIARALLKRAPILILDEPTAGLDAETERAIFATLDNLAPDHATLLITHRLNGLTTAREIVVLRDGRVAERGTHATLLRQGGLYRELYDAQDIDAALKIG